MLTIKRLKLHFLSPSDLSSGVWFKPKNTVEVFLILNYISEEDIRVLKVMGKEVSCFNMTETAILALEPVELELESMTLKEVNEDVS